MAIKMSDSSLENILLIHTGMRPGELIIGHADGSDTIFLPATDWPYRFTVVKNAEREEWAISRTRVGTGALEPLLSFTSLAAAEQARCELHRALLETNPEPVPSRNLNKFTPYIIGAAVSALIIFVFSINSGPSSAGSQDTSQIAPDPAPQSTYISPTAPVAPMPASPGESLLLQIDGAGQASASAQPKPVETTAATQAPATPGEGLLNQIKGD